MKMYKVGSSIHGRLLSPTDIDLVVIADNKKHYRTLVKMFSCGGGIEENKNSDISIATARHGRYNYIIILGLSIDKFTKSMDVNLVKGYIDLDTNKLKLHKEAKEGLKNKQLIVTRNDKLHESIFCHYNHNELQDKRAEKYLKKLPEGFTFEYKK